MEPSPPAFDYPRWIADALRHVARRALEEVEHSGLLPEHHFLVSIRTAAPGVVLPEFLRRQYPDEVTVVLENQFWDLVVDDEGFSVTLAFGGSRHRIFSPWPALTAFADPGAELALRFELGQEAEEDAGIAETDAAPADEEADEDVASGQDADGGEGQVVSMASFRKRRDEDEPAG